MASEFTWQDCVLSYSLALVLWTSLSRACTIQESTREGQCPDACRHSRFKLTVQSPPPRGVVSEYQTSSPAAEAYRPRSCGTTDTGRPDPLRCQGPFGTHILRRQVGGHGGRPEMKGNDTSSHEPKPGRCLLPDRVCSQL